MPCSGISRTHLSCRTHKTDTILGRTSVAEVLTLASIMTPRWGGNKTCNKDNSIGVENVFVLFYSFLHKHAVKPHNLSIFDIFKLVFALGFCERFFFMNFLVFLRQKLISRHFRHFFASKCPNFEMDVLVTLFYILFCICVVYPPTEFVSAGFTIAQLFENYLGSENVNFMGYHMKRMSITVVIHSALPLGYIFCLWCGGERGQWMLAAAAGMAIIALLAIYKMVCWWEQDKSKHPAVKALLPYVTPGSDWRVVAANLNTEFRSVDKVSVPLTATSKFVATETWLIKVTQYNLNVVKQSDCALVATATDSHNLTPSGEDEVQYVNIEVIPSRDDILRFSFRISTTALRDLQPRLAQPVRVPEHISLLPTLIERFVTVFKQHVEQNPVFMVDQEPELCIGCMQAPADVKINRRCLPPPAHLQGGPPQCQQCNCRVLWCCACMARWWAARAAGAASEWLSGRCTCPVCRSVFCLLDVCPARQSAS